VKSSSRFIAGLTLASFAFAAPVAAQDQGSTQVGNATVSIGVGTAMLTLPDVEFLKITNAAVTATIGAIKDAKDFGDEIGLNVNGSIAVPMGPTGTISLNGFWAHIEDHDKASCSIPPNGCGLFSPTNDVHFGAGEFSPPGKILESVSDREVDHWGVSVESKWPVNPGDMGVTQAPPRYFALGADIRGIYQDLAIAVTNAPVGLADRLDYDEDLDTTYYGAYAAWGGDYSIPFLSDIINGLGLQSSFLLRGGLYSAHTDYSGRTVVSFGASPSSLSLSKNDLAFIGGLVLETRKRLGPRAMLSLKTEYEYYSWVPKMGYKDDQFGTGPNSTTSIGSDDAFSARTSLRLTVELGPKELHQ